MGTEAEGLELELAQLPVSACSSGTLDPAGVSGEPGGAGVVCPPVTGQAGADGPQTAGQAASAVPSA